MAAEKIKARNVSWIMFSGFMGSLIFSELYNLVVAVVLIVLPVAGLPLSGGISVYSAHIMLSSAATILGLCVGSWLFIRKNYVFRKVLIPVSWENALINLVISGTVMLITLPTNMFLLSPAVWFAASLETIFFYLSGGFLWNTYVFLIAPASLAVFFVIFYPFSCFVTYIYGRNKTHKKPIISIAVLAFLLNPLFVLFPIDTNYQITREAFYSPCGAELSAFPEHSAAWDAGMSPGDVITKINGTDIMEARDLEDFMGSINSSAPLRVNTLGDGVFILKPYMDQTSNKYTLGKIGVETAWCLKEE
jgi:hypothetical protein